MTLDSKRIIRAVGVAGLILTLAACEGEQTADSAAALAEFKAPGTATVDHVDTYHGVRVADPYRWFEDLDSPETAAWVAAQNAASRPYLDGLPRRGEIKERLTKLWNYERFGVPEKEGGRYFFIRNDGLQDQSVLYTAASMNGERRILIDPNSFSQDGTASLHSYAVDSKGARIAYAVSESGSDWTDIKVRDVATGGDLADHLSFTKFGGYNLAWDPDGGGFYYSRLEAGGDGKRDPKGQVTLHHHVIGTDQSADQPVYRNDDHPTRVPSATVTRDGAYLIIGEYEGFFKNALFVRVLGEDSAEFAPLADAWDGEYAVLGNQGTVFYIRTTAGAPKGRIIAIDLNKPAPADWRTVIAESQDVLEFAHYTGGRIIAGYLTNAHSRVAVYDTGGSLVREVDLPGMGSASGFDGHADDNETFFSYTSYSAPSTVYRYDVASGESTVIHRPTLSVATDNYQTRQVFFTSKDGTRVPMFITHAKGLEPNGKQPTLLYGYGGFNISLTPSFSTTFMMWLDMGGVLAIPNLRGGGEYGEDWHRAGANLNKQNVFDDFIAAAEWLISNGYTSPANLGIYGRSNGGLLIAAAITQRPELFGAAAPSVGVLDMLRYHTPSANARNWKDDYGLSENENEFRAQFAYSPYHNLARTCYPPTLVTTADHDDRVVPWHSFKFGARLQSVQSCKNPVVIRVETRAGHGRASPVWMRIEEIADRWAFFAQALGL